MEKIHVDSMTYFNVNDETLSAARQLANTQRKVTFIGIFPDGAETVGFDRDYLLHLGAHSIAWIIPERMGFDA
jgi:hypothetical protein